MLIEPIKREVDTVPVFSHFNTDLTPVHAESSHVIIQYSKKLLLILADKLASMPFAFGSIIQSIGDLLPGYTPGKSPLEAWTKSNYVTLNRVFAANHPSYMDVMVNKPRGMVVSYDRVTRWQSDLIRSANPAGRLDILEVIALGRKMIDDLTRTFENAEERIASVIEFTHTFDQLTVHVKKLSIEHDRMFSGSGLEDKLISFGTEFGSLKGFRDILALAQSNYRIAKGVDRVHTQLKELEDRTRKLIRVIDDRSDLKVKAKVMYGISKSIEAMSNCIGFYGNIATAELMIEINLITVLENLVEKYKKEM